MRRRLSIAIPVVLSIALSGCASPPRGGPPRPRLRDDEPAVMALPPASREALATSRIPTYVLPEAYAASTVVLVDEHWTQLVVAEEETGAGIALFTTDTWQEEGTEELAGLPPPADVVRGRPAVYSTTEDGAEITWIASGVPYLLQITCADEEDARCTDASFLIDLAESLVPAHQETER